MGVFPRIPFRGRCNEECLGSEKCSGTFRRPFSRSNIIKLRFRDCAQRPDSERRHVHADALGICDLGPGGPSVSRICFGMIQTPNFF